jgi:5-formyltetrahydrofolate cyclo-ligase
MRRQLRVASPVQAAGRAIAELARWLEEHPEVKTVAIYAALPGEVDLAEIVREHPTRRWAFPKVTAAGEMQFYEVADPASQLVPGAFKILEPCDSLARLAVREIDAFVCPGIAFDRRGGRLGRGLGFYDRVLAEARADAYKIGVCFGFQCVEDTFAERHDVPMHHVIAD